MESYEIRLLIKEVVRDILIEEKLIPNEISVVNREEFIENLEEQLESVLWNLACVVIFHDINQYMLDHWQERATNLVKKFFSMKIKEENIDLRRNVVRESFSKSFGDNYENIDEYTYQNRIVTYCLKRGKENMEAKYSAEYYHKTYTSSIVELLNVLEQALVENDHSIWIRAVEKFVNQFRKEFS